MKVTHISSLKKSILCSLIIIVIIIAGFNISAVSDNEVKASVSDTEIITTSEPGLALASSVFSELPDQIDQQNLLIKPDDPYYDKQWALEQTDITRLWELAESNTEVLVAILDTGIDCNHEDLKDKVTAEINLTDSPSVNDINGHGTHISGIIAANIGNGIGVAGLSPSCKILNVKVADDYGFCNAQTVANGIIWAVNNGANVINISLEIRNPSMDLERAVNYAWNHGVLVVAAAGNQGNALATYPAYYDNCIAVSAVKPDGSLAPLSIYGDWVDVVAPGYNIYSTLPDNTYGYETGTSFATGYITGLTAILLSIVNDTNGNGKLNDEIRNIIDNCYCYTDYDLFLSRVINAVKNMQEFE